MSENVRSGVLIGMAVLVIGQAVYVLANRGKWPPQRRRALGILAPVAIALAVLTLLSILFFG